jgi:isopentenyl-diphosphate delta-isomerase
MEQRKKDHISLAFKTQTGPIERDDRFQYEPLLSGHPQKEIPPIRFGNKKMRFPLWVSSMTGGTKMAGTINRNLAQAANEFGLGMGLGSCHIVLKNEKALPDFDLRKVIGEEQPFYANMGIAQIEAFLKNDDINAVNDLIKLLQADGLAVHVNPIQEWLQPEGDEITEPPIETLKAFLKEFKHPVIVKEVGQGMGYESMKQLLSLPLTAIEFGAFGGTNFAKVELFRHHTQESAHLDPFTYVGHTAEEMMFMVNQMIEENHPINTEMLILSGGIKNFLDGYYLMNKSKMPAIYGMASSLLRYAREDYPMLQSYVKMQIEGYKMARAFLKVI